jgi:integral membrane protein (TIGR00529 family)
MIAFYVSLYRRKDIIKDLGEGLQKIFRNDILILTMVPGVIGLLPVPGGALLSAPIVDVVGDQRGLNGSLKLFINVWYRHIILFFYPLSTTIIFTSALTRISPWSLSILSLPLASIMFILGLTVFIKRSSHIINRSSTSYLSNDRIKRSVLPIMTTIAVSLMMALSGNPLLSNDLYVIISVLLGIIILIILNRLAIRDISEAFKDKRMFEMIFLAFSIMLFRNFYSTIDLRSIQNFLITHTFDLRIMIILLPLFFSLISGHPTTGIAVATPILLSLTQLSRDMIMIIYTASFLGYLGSPMHACYLYTDKYLQTPVRDGYKYLIPYTLISLLAGFILYSML